MDTFCVEGAKFSLSMTSTQMESSVRKRGLLFTFHAFLILHGRHKILGWRSLALNLGSLQLCCESAYPTKNMTLF